MAPPKDPLGPNKDMLPVDRNVTFLIDYDQGTIEELLFYNMTDGTNDLIMTFNITDKFDAKKDRINIPLPDVRTILSINKLFLI